MPGKVFKITLAERPQDLPANASRDAPTVWVQLQQRTTIILLAFAEAPETKKSPLN